MKKQPWENLNNAQKAVACLTGVLFCINLIQPVAMLTKNNPAIPALMSLAAQVLFVMFVYFSLIWIRKD